MSPLSRGISMNNPSIDAVLYSLGLSHPCITIQLLISIGFIVLGLGSLETSTLLPVPLYSCWDALNAVDFSGRNICENVALLDSTTFHRDAKLWACGNSDAWWQPTFWPGAVIAVTRMFIAICAGVGLDIFGRRRCAVAWMGIYFVFSFARSFAPKTEVLVMSITMEGLSAQAATMALLLLASEGSTQKECVRSVCLVLIGHALGCAVLIPIISTHIVNEMFKQLTRSIPAVLFILFIFFLPESFRWVVTRGRLEEIGPALKKSHHAALEETVRGKLAAVYQEMRKCLAMCGSRGSAMKQAIFPLILCRPLRRILFPIIIISFLFGSAIGFRHSHDPLPYQSVEDRVIAYGVAELLALQFLGLLLARLSVRKVLFSLAGVFTAAILLTRAFRTAGYASCVADICFSSGGHFVAVLLWVWLVCSTIRLTPTHSRGTMLGVTLGFGTLGHALSMLILRTLTITLRWHEYYAALLYAALVIIGGIIVLFLPSTPSTLPDMTSHVAPHLHWAEDAEEVPRHENATAEENENTRL